VRGVFGIWRVLKVFLTLMIVGGVLLLPAYVVRNSGVLSKGLVKGVFSKKVFLKALNGFGTCVALAQEEDDLGDLEDEDFGDEDTFGDEGMEEEDATDEGMEMENTELGDELEDSGGATEATEGSAKWRVEVEPVKDLGGEPDYGKNPFKPTIRKKVKEEPVVQQLPEEPKVEEVPPLPLKLLGVSISDDMKIAILELNGKVYELEEGQGVPGLFQVTSISDDKVVVYDERRNANQILSFEE